MHFLLILHKLKKLLDCPWLRYRIVVNCVLHLKYLQLIFELLMFHLVLLLHFEQS